VCARSAMTSSKRARRAQDAPELHAGTLEHPVRGAGRWSASRTPPPSTATSATRSPTRSWPRSWPSAASSPTSRSAPLDATVREPDRSPSNSPILASFLDTPGSACNRCAWLWPTRSALDLRTEQLRQVLGATRPISRTRRRPVPCCGSPLEPAGALAEVVGYRSITPRNRAVDGGAAGPDQPRRGSRGRLHRTSQRDSRPGTARRARRRALDRRGGNFRVEAVALPPSCRAERPTRLEPVAGRRPSAPRRPQKPQGRQDPGVRARKALARRARGSLDGRGARGVRGGHGQSRNRAAPAGPSAHLRLVLETHGVSPLDRLPGETSDESWAELIEHASSGRVVTARRGTGLRHRPHQALGDGDGDGGGDGNGVADDLSAYSEMSGHRRLGDRVGEV